MKSERGDMKLISVFFILFSLIVSGCAGTITILDKNKSDLMPKSVAMSIFEKYGFKEWSEKPFVRNINTKCSPEKEFIELDQICSAQYFQGQNMLNFKVKGGSFYCNTMWARFDNITETQAIELTNAVHALGANKIDQLQSGGF